MKYIVLFTERKTGDLFKAWVRLAGAGLRAVDPVPCHPVGAVPAGEGPLCRREAEDPREAGVGVAGGSLPSLRLTGLAVTGQGVRAVPARVVFNAIGRKGRACHTCAGDTYLLTYIEGSVRGI